MNSYELSRVWFDYAFANPEKIKPIHSAIYFFAIEHCNRLGWKEKFGFPSQMVMEAIGVKNWKTYSKALNEIVDFGFIKMIEISKNQYSSNIIAIVKNTKANTKALDKALSNHNQKQSTKQSRSTVSIDKQLNKEQLNKEQLNNIIIPPVSEFLEYVKTIEEFKNKFESLKFAIESKYETWVSDGWKDGNGKKIVNWKTKLKNTLPYLKPIFNNHQNGTGQPKSKAEQLNADMADFARRHGLLPDTPAHGGSDTNNEFTEHTEL